MRRTLVNEDELVIQTGRAVKLRRDAPPRGNARNALLDTMDNRGVWAIQEYDTGAEVEYRERRPNEWYPAGEYPGWLAILLDDAGAEHAEIAALEDAEAEAEE